MQDNRLDIGEIKKRAAHSAFEDGLVEIFMGFFLFVYGAALASKAVPLGVIMIVFMIFFQKPVAERIKRKYIYPRAGYYRMPPEPDKTGKGIAVAAVVMMAVLVGSMVLSILTLGMNPGIALFLDWIVPPASGLMLAIGPFWLGRKYGLVRGYVTAVIFALGGIAMPVFSIASGYRAVGLLSSFVGFIILAAGLAAFIRFVRKNPPIDYETEVEDA